MADGCGGVSQSKKKILEELFKPPPLVAGQHFLQSKKNYIYLQDSARCEPRLVVQPCRQVHRGRALCVLAAVQGMARLLYLIEIHFRT